MRTETSRTVRLEDYAPSPYQIPHVSLVFDLHRGRTTVTAELTVTRREGTATTTPLDLDGDELELVSIRIDGRRLGDTQFAVSPRGLTVKKLPAARTFKLQVTTACSPEANRKLMGLYVSNDVFCTQCEAEGFRRITYFLDRPDVLSTYSVRIEADRHSAPVLLSNGNPVEQGQLPAGRHYAVWHDPHPKPCYLFALVAGDLAEVTDSIVTKSGRKVRLGIHVEHGKQARAAYAMDALKRAMRWDEDVFGREYDLDVFNIVAVSEFNIGAMENKGLNIFNDKFVLADEETATDADFANVETLISHEYFHNWTGNRITCRDWFQLCLKEGLTVYRDHEFSADQRSGAVRRIQEVKLLKAQQFPEDQGPLAHPVRPRRYREINNFYTATVYEKGAEIVRMLRILLGAEGFRAGIDLYFNRHDGQAVTIEDFLAAMADASGQDLTQFALWYHQAGTPLVSVATNYDEAASTFTIDLEQAVPPTPSEHRKRVMHIPLQFGLVGDSGSDIPFATADGAVVVNGTIHLRRRHQRVVFSGVRQQPVLSINRGFSAPVAVARELSGADLLFLAKNDSDQFGRWQALTSTLTDLMTVGARSVRWGKPWPNLEEIKTLLRDISTDQTLEPAMRALMLTLPLESDVARALGENVDPDAILTSRDRSLAEIALANESAFARTHDQMSENAPFRPDGEGAGRRALHAVLLEYLSLAENSPDRARACYLGATNMTDRMAALTILVHRFHESSACREALHDYESRYAGDPLALDKWFHVQATRPSRDAVETVTCLRKHPHFDIENPNRVRALIFALASANQTGFNQVDGAGYALLADTVLEVDRINPILASRLATCFRIWRSLEAGRQEKARQALAGIARSQGLSKNVADIIQRTLA